LTPQVGDYKIKWNGVGTAFVQLISSYHVMGKDYEPLYRLKADATLMEGLPTMSISFRLPGKSSSTMYLLEVASPTGMVFTKSLIEGQLQLTDGGFSAITRYDIKEGGQRLHLYVDPATKLKDIELNIPMDSKFDVANRMPVQISLIDYYNPSKRQTVFYSMEDSTDTKDEKRVTGCSISLSCDLLQSAEAIVLGYPGKIRDGSFDIKNATPYKACGGDFVERQRATAKLDESLNQSCVSKLKNTRSVFILRYTEEGQMEVTGLTDYNSALPKLTECSSVVNQCPE